MPRVFEKQHFKNSQIYDTDDFFASHNSSNDFSVTLAQIQSMPVGKCQTASDVAAKVVTLLADSFGLFTIKDKTDSTKGLIGRTISVNFTNKNTASSMTLNVASTGAFPVTSHGVAVKAGAIGVGNYTFRFMPYGSSYSWDVLDNNGLIEVKSDKNVFWDNHEELTAAQVNSALTDKLADYEKSNSILNNSVTSGSEVYYKISNVYKSSTYGAGLGCLRLLTKWCYALDIFYSGWVGASTNSVSLEAHGNKHSNVNIAIKYNYATNDNNGLEIFVKVSGNTAHRDTFYKMGENNNAHPKIEILENSTEYDNATNTVDIPTPLIED